MPDAGQNLLAAMITPAVLISACGTLIFSTSTRLARNVDRVRVLTQHMEELFSGMIKDFPDERRRELEVQLGYYARRSRIIQGSLTSLYVSLGIFVAASVSAALTTLVSRLTWLPGLLGVAGTLALFVGAMLLIRETGLALRAVNSEMEFALRLGRMYQARHSSSPPDAGGKGP
jgi:hypothetical protein